MKYRFMFKGSHYLDPSLLSNAQIPNNVDPNGIIDPFGRYYTYVGAVLLWVPKGEEKALQEINLFNRTETGGMIGDEQQFAIYPVLDRVLDARFITLNGYDDWGYIFEGGFKNRTHPADVIGDVQKGDMIYLLCLSSDNYLFPLKNYLQFNKINDSRGSVTGTLSYLYLADVNSKNSAPVIVENIGTLDAV